MINKYLANTIKTCFHHPSTQPLSSLVQKIPIPSTNKPDINEYIPGKQGYAPGFGPPSVEQNQYYKRVVYEAQLKRYKKFIINKRVQKRLAITKDRAKITGIMCHHLKIKPDKINFLYNEKQDRSLVYDIRKEDKFLYVSVITNFPNIIKDKNKTKSKEIIEYEQKIEKLKQDYRLELESVLEKRSEDAQQKKAEEFKAEQEFKEKRKAKALELVLAMKSAALDSGTMEDGLLGDVKQNRAVEHISKEDIQSFKDGIETKRKKQEEAKEKSQQKSTQVKMEKITKLIHMAYNFVTPSNIDMKLEKLLEAPTTALGSFYECESDPSSPKKEGLSSFEEAELFATRTSGSPPTFHQQLLDKANQTDEGLPKYEYYLNIIKQNSNNI